MLSLVDVCTRSLAQAIKVYLKTAAGDSVAYLQARNGVQWPIIQEAGPNESEAQTGIGRGGRVQWSALQRGAGGRGVSSPSTTTIGDEIEGLQAIRSSLYNISIRKLC